MELNTLKDLYIHELKDLYSAEKQIIRALPKMVKAASNEQLAAGFKEHLEETKEHAARLEKILSSHNQTTRGPKCKGMEGVLQEGADYKRKGPLRALSICYGIPPCAGMTRLVPSYMSIPPMPPMPPMPPPWS